MLESDVREVAGGTEGDALVARRVFGHAVQEVPGGYVCSPRENGVTLTVACEIPPYSKEIAAAWQVVEAVRARGTNPVIGWSFDEWAVSLNPGNWWDKLAPF